MTETEMICNCLSCNKPMKIKRDSTGNQSMICEDCRAKILTPLAKRKGGCRPCQRR